MAENITVDKNEIKNKIPTFVKLPTILEEQFIEYFYDKNVVPNRVCVYDRVGLSEEITVLATVKLEESKIEYYSFTYNHITKQVLIDKIK